MKGEAMICKMKDGESLVTAWPEPCTGPGWSNSPLYYIIREPAGKMRTECLQPKEQSTEIRLLYGIAAAAHGSLMRAVENWIRLS